MIGTPRWLASCRGAACAGVRADVLAEEEDAVGVLEILQHDRSTGDADALGKRHRCAFVAHVRAVGQIVGAVHAARTGRTCRLVSSEARPEAVEHGDVRIELLSSSPIPAKASSHSTGRYLSVAASHRIGWVSRPASSSSWSGQVSQFRHGVLREKLGVTRLLVSSQAVALAPFSQNSNGCGFAGLAQEQLTHEIRRSCSDASARGCR